MVNYCTTWVVEGAFLLKIRCRKKSKKIIEVTSTIKIKKYLQFFKNFNFSPASVFSNEVSNPFLSYINIIKIKKIPFSNWNVKKNHIGSQTISVIYTMEIYFFFFLKLHTLVQTIFIYCRHIDLPWFCVNGFKVHRSTLKLVCVLFRTH